MGVLQRFERRLEGLVGTAFARLFKGQVEPVEVAKALQREAEARRAIVGQDRVLVPNRYVVELGPTDHDRLAPWETQLTNTLAEMVQEHVDDEGWSTFGDIEVTLSRNEELGTGMFHVSSSVDPNAGPRRRPYNSLSMPAVAAGGALPPPGGGGAPYGGGGYGSGCRPGLRRGVRRGLRPGPRLRRRLPGAVRGAGQRLPRRGQWRLRAAGDRAAAGVQQQQQRLRHLLTVDGSQQWVELQVGSNVIGRGTEADIRLPDTGVCRRHVDVGFDGVGAVLRTSAPPTAPRSTATARRAGSCSTATSSGSATPSWSTGRSRRDCSGGSRHGAPRGSPAA